MRKIHAVVLMGFAAAGFADTLTLRNGRVVEGTYLGGSARQIRMAAGDRIEAFDVSEVASLQFAAAPAVKPAAAPAPAAVSAPVPAPAPAAAAVTAPVRGESNVFRPDPAPAPSTTAAAGVTEIPAGTNFVIRMIDAVDSSTNQVGQTFQASMDEPVMIDGNTVVPRGADVVVKLVDDKEAGRLTGRTELTLDLVSVKVNGRVVDINTQSVTQTSGSQTGRTAKLATGGAALGAIIGAIAGGGKGAAIGAVSGAGAGTAAGAITKGQQVRIPSETRLTFTLDTAVKL